MPMTTAASKYPRGLYDPRPVLELSGLDILDGSRLEQRVASLAKSGVLLVDGFLGIDWGAVREWLLRIDGLQSFETIDTHVAMLTAEEVERRVARSIPVSDPVFGRLFEGILHEFFSPLGLAGIRRRVASGNALVIGPGAALADPAKPVVYVDLSKESQQSRMASITNLGQTSPSPREFYRRAFFVDWPVLEKHRQSIRTRIAVWIDTNSDKWSGLGGDDLRESIGLASGRPFRVKPWFLPGPWGGQFLKGHVGLDPSQPNFAWSYELIAPENGVLIGNGTKSIEVPFPFMVAQEADSYLGSAVAARFGNQFPIRFDYLDTIEGGNLSCQCHPSDAFIREQFGELFTQDESYYVLECEPGSKVFLGFREDRNPEDFWRTARSAEGEGKPFEISDFMNGWPSRKHDIFLIPNGIIHCSGRGNLVLEISATPYIYTFKIYDYLRRDLGGQFRRLYVDYAERNARYKQTASWVRTNLMPLPRLLRRGADWQEFVVADNPLLFYKIHRLEFCSRLCQHTNGTVVVVNLVEGEQADIVADPATLRIHYGETAVIPAATGRFELVNRGRSRAKLVKAFVRTCG